MSDRDRTKPYEIVDLLVKTSMGIEKADIVLCNGKLVNVLSGEIERDIDVAIKRDRIALVGNADHTIGNRTRIIELDGAYMVPGLIDAHMHIESSMLSPRQFAKVVLPQGTTTIFIDPHEIANVLGIRGVRFFIEQTKDLPLKVFVTAPTCVPPNPEFETSGAVMTAHDIEELLKLPSVIGLGEMMTFPNVIEADREALEKIKSTLRLGKVVEGHAPQLSGRELSAYIAAGISSCHESTSWEEVVEKVRRGMYAYIREGSAWLDVKECIKALTEEGIDPRFLALVTDDREVSSLLLYGHMNYVIRRAIEEGLNPITAIQLATINPAIHYGLDRFIGCIAPLRSADILILEELVEMKPKMVFADGKLVAVNGKLVIEIPYHEVPSFVLNTVNIPYEIRPDDFVIRSKIREGKLKIRVIGVREGNVLTKHLIEEVEAVDGEIKADIGNDILKVALLERHTGRGSRAIAFVKGFGLKAGAVASTVAHDTHNLLVMGTNDVDMAFAVRRVKALKGGLVAVRDEEVIAEVPLPISGLMSEAEAEEVGFNLSKLSDAWKELGCRMVSPFMTMSLLSLSVIPELRITDKGLFDSVNFKLVQLILD
jgi:adenine deaminase